jgi:hypothetical protein
MKSTNAKKKPIVGKTVKGLEQPSCNCLVLHFTDGTKVTLETEHVGHGICGIVQLPGTLD